MLLPGSIPSLDISEVFLEYFKLCFSFFRIDEIYKMMKLQANILKTISQQSEGKEDHGAENEEDGSKKKKSVWLM